MKKLILILTIICLFPIYSFSQNHYFENNKFERINSDFNGSLSIGNTFLIYGNGGVIIRSSDRGKNWERINLIDSINIVHIINVNSKLIGLSSKNVAISSIDEGKTWELIPLGTNLNFYQLKYYNNQFYILLKNKLWITDLDFKLVKEYTITTDSLNQSFVLRNQLLLYNAGNGNLGQINLQNDEQKIIEISKKVNCANCNITSKIKSNDNDLIYFAMKTNCYEYNFNTQQLNLKFNFTRSIGYGFDIYNNEIYYVISRNYPWGLDSISFLKYDNLKSNIQSLKKSKKDHYIKNITFSDLNFISKDTIIAIGQNNLLYISNDAGLNWELKSFLGNFFKMFKFDSKNAVVIGEYAQLFSTDNNGVTWLPQENFPAKIATDTRFYYPGNYRGTIFFKDKLNGFISVNPSYEGDTNLIFTNNGGKKTNLTANSTIHFNNYQTFSTSYKNQYLFFAYGNIGFNLGTYTVIFNLDDTLGVLKKTVLKAKEFYYATNWKDNIYALAFDSLDAKNTFSIFKSMDGGSNWTKEFTFQVKNQASLSTLDISHIDNSIYTNWTTKEINGKDTNYIKNLYRIDLEKKLASNIYSGKVDGINSIFKINDKYYVSTYSFLKNGIEMKLLFSDNINTSNVIWKENTSSRFGIAGIFPIASDSSFCLAVTDSLINKSAIYFVNSKANTSVSYQSEDQNYFYSYPPYPIPAFNEVKSLIFWDMSFDIDASEISVFDVFGNKIDDKSNIKINKLNSYSGYITWDCSKATSGVYMIQLKHGNKTNNISVMVVR